MFVTRPFQPTRRGLLVALGALCALPLSFARPAAAQGGEVLLEVVDAAGTVTEFDLAALDALEQSEITTSTNWTEGVLVFSGPPLAAVLAAAGMEMGPVDAVAANDYEVRLTFPPGDAAVPIVATRIGGEPIERREKGPLWVIFPYDSDPAYRTVDVFGQSIWHLQRLSAGTGP